MEKDFLTDNNEIYALVKGLSKKMIDTDIPSINNILDKEFTLTHITGYVQTKKEWLSEIENENMKYYSSNEVKHDIKISGSSAEVIWQSIIDARIWGSRNSWRLQQKMKLKKINNAWVILSSVASIF
jgi:hypothetical protein